jgi:hypothetical protein
MWPLHVSISTTDNFAGPSILQHLLILLSTAEIVPALAIAVAIVALSKNRLVPYACSHTPMDI